MEIIIKTTLISMVLLLFTLTAHADCDFKAVYVTDFHSDDNEQCKPSDVDLSHHQARQFFIRAKPVDYRVIHDHYTVAPCYIEGTMQYQSMLCDWKIRAGGTGQIKCHDTTTYFVCDTCEALFQPQ